MGRCIFRSVQHLKQIHLKLFCELLQCLQVRVYLSQLPQRDGLPGDKQFLGQFLLGKPRLFPQAADVSIYGKSHTRPLLSPPA